ncbi:exosome complex RNA-binding protein Rrp4 [Methanopyrus sp.]
MPEFELYVEDRQVVTPGELLARGQVIASEGTYTKGNEVYSKVTGLVDIDGRRIKVIPLAGPYRPSPGDFVIGIVEEVKFSSWLVDVRAPLPAILHVSNALEEEVDLIETDLSRYYRPGDVIAAVVQEVDPVQRVELSLLEDDAPTRLGRLRDGRVVEIDPVKVPRVIGRKGSMIKMLKRVLGCDIIVGANGRIYVRAREEPKKERELLTVRAIREIERRSHLRGLTDWLKANLKRLSRW